MTRAPEPILVTVLRHGEVAGPAHVFRGVTDVPLTPQGQGQMAAIIDAVGPFARIASSPLRRCRAFAETLTEASSSGLELLPAMAEMAFGAWEGLTWAQASAAHPDRFAAFARYAESAGAPGGETLAGFRKRVLAGWAGWLADGTPGHRLLITHAGVMRMLLQHILDLPDAALYRVALPYAAYFQVSELSGQPPVLLGLNACKVSGSHSAF